MAVSRTFHWLMASLLLLLGLGIWLLVLGIQSSPFSLPFVSFL